MSTEDFSFLRTKQENLDHIDSKIRKLESDLKTETNVIVRNYIQSEINRLFKERMTFDAGADEATYAKAHKNAKILAKLIQGEDGVYE